MGAAARNDGNQFSLALLALLDRRLFRSVLIPVATPCPLDPQTGRLRCHALAVRRYPRSSCRFYGRMTVLCRSSTIIRSGRELPRSWAAHRHRLLRGSGSSRSHSQVVQVSVLKPRIGRSPPPAWVVLLERRSRFPNRSRCSILRSQSRRSRGRPRVAGCRGHGGHSRAQCPMRGSGFVIGDQCRGSRRLKVANHHLHRPVAPVIPDVDTVRCWQLRTGARGQQSNDDQDKETHRVPRSRFLRHEERHG